MKRYTGETLEEHSERSLHFFLGNRVIVNILDAFGYVYWRIGQWLCFAGFAALVYYEMFVLSGLALIAGLVLRLTFVLRNESNMLRATLAELHLRASDPAYQDSPAKPYRL
ncbi:hypothetical protein KUV46_15855 [Thalassovita mediterranea]|nr:hypothetical protein KUV46_15855 [Thalassovita mediterranea]